MTNLPISQTTDDALTAIVHDVSARIRFDVDLVAHATAANEQLILQMIEEIDHLRIANAQLYIKCQLERKAGR